MLLQRPPWGLSTKGQCPRSKKRLRQLRQGDRLKDRHSRQPYTPSKSTSNLPKMPRNSPRPLQRTCQSTNETTSRYTTRPKTRNNNNILRHDTKCRRSTRKKQTRDGNKFYFRQQKLHHPWTYAKRLSRNTRNAKVSNEWNRYNKKFSRERYLHGNNEPRNTNARTPP